MIEIALIDALGALAINWVKERRDAKAEVDAGAFKDWLRNVAFDQLINNADQTLRSVVSLKASNQEHFDQILRLLNEVHETLHGRAARQRWLSLTQTDRSVLQALYEDGLSSEYGAGIHKPGSICETTDEDTVLRSCKAVSEMGYATEYASTGGYEFRMETAGFLFVWEATDTPPYDAGIIAIEKAMNSIARGDTQRLEAVVEETKVPLGLVAAYAEKLAETGDLRIQQYDSRKHTLVWDISESLRRRADARISAEPGNA